MTYKGNQVSRENLNFNALASTDVINNTTSTDTNKPLSANQGKVIDEKVNGHIQNKNNPHNTTTGQVNYLGEYVRNITDPISDYPIGVSVMFVRNEQNGFPNYGTVTTTHAHMSGGSAQIYTPYSNELGGKNLLVRRTQYPNATWTTWEKLGGVDLIDSYQSNSTTLAPTANALSSVYNIITAPALALGYDAKAVANGATALGFNANALDAGSSALGLNTVANSRSTALGNSSKATSTNGHSSFALGNGAEGTNGGFALGMGAKAVNFGVGTLGVTYASADGTRDWTVPGNFAVQGTKTFEIPYPHPEKKDTHRLRYGCVESPTAGDTLYRYSITASKDGETVEIELSDYFKYLNTNVDVWVNPNKHFGRAYGEVIDNKLFVTCEKAGEYKALVIGTRNDDSVQDWYMKGTVKENGESWTGETYMYEVEEFSESVEFKEDI